MKHLTFVQEVPAKERYLLEGLFWRAKDVLAWRARQKGAVLAGPPSRTVQRHGKVLRITYRQGYLRVGCRCR